MSVAGFTSTGSKRPDILFGTHPAAVPTRMLSASGCTVRAEDGRDYLDFVMALGAVALGYGDPDVNTAVIDAVGRGGIGSLAPIEEALLADELAAIMPWLEEVRFLKTGAEAVAAAVRIARVTTGRDQVIGCGYHGWLDWSSSAAGVPAAVQGDFRTIPFNDAAAARTAIRASGDRLACVVIEPVIEGPAAIEWLMTLRTETARVGAVLVYDEIKTGFRIALGGAAELSGITPDLMVLGKALANGFPLAAVGGSRAMMAAVSRTWISSTMATEFVALAASRATVAAMVSRDVPGRLGELGAQLFGGLAELAAAHGHLGIRAVGVPEMCYLRYDDDALSARVAAECARRGLLFKRTAYNFVSMAHDERTVTHAVDTLREVLAEC